MTQSVRYNIVGNGNIDTSTLISNLQSNVSQSSGGNVTTIEVASDGSSYPTGPKEYAAALEAMGYANFMPALEENVPVMATAMGDIKIHE